MYNTPKFNHNQQFFPQMNVSRNPNFGSVLSSAQKPHDGEPPIATDANLMSPVSSSAERHMPNQATFLLKKDSFSRILPSTDGVEGLGLADQVRNRLSLQAAVETKRDSRDAPSLGN